MAINFRRPANRLYANEANLHRRTWSTWNSNSEGSGHGLESFLGHSGGSGHGLGAFLGVWGWFGDILGGMGLDQEVLGLDRPDFGPF